MSKVFYRILVILITVSILATSAYAAYSYSDPLNDSIYSHSYTYCSTIDGSFLPYSMTFGLKVTASPAADTNYIRVKCRLFKSTGSLEYSTNYFYNQASTTVYPPFYSIFVPSNQYYYSRGLVGFYNGNGYCVDRECTATVDMKLGDSGTGNNTPEYMVNNESEDSIIEINGIGYIKAIGIQGQEGFIKLSDYNGETPKDLSEATAYMEEIKKLYEKGECKKNTCFCR